MAELEEDDIDAQISTGLAQLRARAQNVGPQPAIVLQPSRGSASSSAHTEDAHASAEGAPPPREPSSREDERTATREEPSRREDERTATREEPSRREDERTATREEPSRREDERTATREERSRREIVCGAQHRASVDKEVGRQDAVEASNASTTSTAPALSRGAQAKRVAEARRKEAEAAAWQEAEEKEAEEAEKARRAAVARLRRSACDKAKREAEAEAMLKRVEERKKEKEEQLAELKRIEAAIREQRYAAGMARRSREAAVREEEAQAKARRDAEARLAQRRIQAQKDKEEAEAKAEQLEKAERARKAAEARVMKASLHKARHRDSNMSVLERLKLEQQQTGLAPPKPHHLVRLRDGKLEAETRAKRAFDKESNLLHLFGEAEPSQDEIDSENVQQQLYTDSTTEVRAEKNMHEFSWAQDQALDLLMSTMLAPPDAQPRSATSPSKKSLSSVGRVGLAARRSTAGHSMGTEGWIPWD